MGQHEDNRARAYKLPRFLPLVGRCCPTGSAATCGAPPSGRAVTQLMGQCRGRTHVPMALFRDPAPRGVVTATATNRQCRPTREWPTFNGRLEVDCERSAGGSPQHGDGRRHHREPRVSLFPKEKPPLIRSTPNLYALVNKCLGIATSSSKSHIRDY